MPYRLPPLSALRIFEAAARTLSFKEAAAELFLTPSAVSRGVQSLEDWLEVELFTRGQRSVALTDAGRIYAARVREALDLLMEATETLPGRRRRAPLVISTAPTFGLRWLMPRLNRFRGEHPDIEISVETSMHQVDFLRDGIDLAIRMGQGGWPNVEAVHLVTEALVPVCAPSVARDIRTPADLAAATLLHVTPVSQEWEFWAQARGLAELDTARGPRFDTIQYALSAAAAGLGVALGRRPIVDLDLKAGTLVEVLGPAVPTSTSYWVVCPPQALERRDVRAFRNWVLREFRQEPEADQASAPGSHPPATASEPRVGGEVTRGGTGVSGP